jgi:crossover junction endodeoxyribonuclease RusA
MRNSRRPRAVNGFPAVHRLISYLPHSGRSRPNLSQPIGFRHAQSSLELPLKLTLPLPPSINHQYATVQGRRVLSLAGRQFKSRVGQEILFLLAKRRAKACAAEALDGMPLLLCLRFYFTSAARRDIDGGLKITQDAVCEALGINDNRIVEVRLRKHLDPAAPRMELLLEGSDL